MQGRIATRAVRVVILSAGLLFAKGASLADFELLAPAVYVLAGLSTITVLQRIFHVRKALERRRDARSSTCNRTHLRGEWSRTSRKATPL